MKAIRLIIPALIVLSLAFPGKTHAQSTEPKDRVAMTSDVFLPNAFSPNGDGLNDRFSPVFLKEKPYTVYSFKIFNRKGKEVYSGGSNAAGWDGTSGGSPVASATYFYCLEVFGADGHPRTFKGDVVLIR